MIPKGGGNHIGFEGHENHLSQLFSQPVPFHQEDIYRAPPVKDNGGHQTGSPATTREDIHVNGPTSLSKGR